MTETNELQIPDWLKRVYEERGVDPTRLNLDSDAIDRANELGEEGVKALLNRGLPSDTSSEHHRGVVDKEELVALAEKVQRFGETGVLEEWASDAPVRMKTTSGGAKDKPIDWIADETRTVHRVLSSKSED